MFRNENAWWMCNVSSLNKNENVRENLGVTNLAQKIRKNRQRRFGHVKKKNNDDAVKRINQQKEIEEGVGYRKSG